MAKPATILIRMLSSGKSGYFYVTKKNPKKKSDKLEMRKYDPKLRQHVTFREAKIK